MQDLLVKGRKVKKREGSMNRDVLDREKGSVIQDYMVKKQNHVTCLILPSPTFILVGKCHSHRYISPKYQPHDNDIPLNQIFVSIPQPSRE